MATDQNGLLFLGHGSYWVNFIQIDQNESLAVCMSLLCQNPYFSLQTRTGAIFLCFSVELGQMFSARSYLLFMLLSSV